MHPYRPITVGLGFGLALGLSVGLAPAQAQSIHQTQPVNQAQSVNDELRMPFTDVPADHWAYQALLNLAGVYGCVGGYPDGTFRGENDVTRYEFAAGMDACLSVINTLLQQQQTQQQELDALRDDLQQSFQELRDLDSAL